MKNKHIHSIEGLRAFAVLFVIAFHFEIFNVAGGYIGVDIFFVISGFLISKMTFEKYIVNDNFDFRAFIDSRLRRIWPALSILLIITFLLSYYLFMSHDMRAFSASMFFTSFFVSNVHYWTQSGYFDITSSLNPLLHTWSLSLEIQYYLIYSSIFLILIRLRMIRYSGLILNVILLSSFAISSIAVYIRPVATFYLAPTRFWEFLVGAVVYKYFLSNSMFSRVGNNVANYISSLGLSFLFLIIFIYDKAVHFPGINALAPVFCVSVILLFARKGGLIDCILTSKIMVGIGTISYSLYLYHLPILIFFRTWYVGEVDGFINILLISFTLFVSYISWKFVEVPFRDCSIIRRNTFYWYIALTFSLLVLIGYSGIKTNGVFINKFRSNDYISISNYSNYFDGKSEEEFWSGDCFNVSSNVDFFRKNNCVKYANNNDSFLLLGDSHAAYLSVGLRDLIKSTGSNYSQITSAYCVPFATTNVDRRCTEINEYIFEVVEAIKPKKIVIFANYIAYDKNEVLNYASFLAGIANKLKKHGAEKVLIVGQIPTWRPSLPSVIMKSFIVNNSAIPVRLNFGVEAASILIDDRFKRTEFSEGVEYWSIKDQLCNADGCLIRVGDELSKDLIVYDYGHLTKAGSQFITSKFKLQFLN
jgi:peptidoglycan/LPS O-acetylase OafA/YrhL